MALAKTLPCLCSSSVPHMSPSSSSLPVSDLLTHQTIHRLSRRPEVRNDSLHRERMATLQVFCHILFLMASKRGANPLKPLRKPLPNFRGFAPTLETIK